MQQLHDGKPALIFTYSLSAKAKKVVKGRNDITVFCHTNSNDTEVLKSTGETILSGINLWDCGMATKEKYQHLLAICYKENRDIRRRRV